MTTLLNLLIWGEPKPFIFLMDASGRIAEYRFKTAALRDAFADGYREGADVAIGRARETGQASAALKWGTP